MRILKLIGAAVLAAAGLFTAPAFAADNIDCAIEMLQETPEYSVVGYAYLLAFADPKQSFSKSGASMDLGATVESCRAEHDWSKSAATQASEYTVASAALEYIRVQMEIADVPEDFGKKMYNAMSNAQLVKLKKTGALPPKHAALVQAAMLKHFGKTPENFVKIMFVRWPQLLAQRDSSALKFIKL